MSRASVVPLVVVGNPTGRLCLGLHQDELAGRPHLGVQRRVSGCAPKVDDHRLRATAEALPARVIDDRFIRVQDGRETALAVDAADPPAVAGEAASVEAEQAALATPEQSGHKAAKATCSTALPAELRHQRGPDTRVQDVAGDLLEHLRQPFPQALARAQRAGHALALLFIDLDNFKLLNDTLGHDVGDQLLRQVADRLRHAVRETDHLSRLGGDEFVVVLENLGETEFTAVHEASAVGAPKLVVVSTTHDPATPYENGVNLARQLDASLISFEGSQHTVSLEGNACVDDAVTAYLRDLKPPAEGLRCTA